MNQHRGAGRTVALLCLYLVVVPVRAADQAAAVPARAASERSADVLFVNGNILTMDAAASAVQAVAVKDGRIIELGTDAEVQRLASPHTTVIDLQTKTALPGFIDGHAHPSITTRVIDKYLDGRFATTPSVAALLRKIALQDRQTPVGEWIIVAGSSSSQTRFAERRLPTRGELDMAAPKHPALFLNGMHEMVVNTAGLEKIGIAKGMRILRGAHIVLDAQGVPTGVVQEPMGVFPDVRIPPDDLRRYYEDVIPQNWNAQGYTSVLAITPLAELPVIKEVAARTAPTLRYTLAYFTDPGGKLLPASFDAMKFPAGVDPIRFRFGGVKIWVDSDLPMMGGALRQPYAGTADKFGLLNLTQDELDAAALRTRRAGVALLLHATGDRAVDMALTAFERAQSRAPVKSLQRIEHFDCFLYTPGDIKRAKQLGVAVNVQPAWITTLVNSTLTLLGPERGGTAFQFRSMIAGGLEPGFGSDVTGIVLETMNPFLHMYAAVTRNSDLGLFHAEQAVTVIEALRMLTIWAARAQEEDDIKGSLEVGKLADMVVLADDIMTIPPENIRNLQVLKTIVGGRVVYDAAQ